jgi:SAM-dependent methyltransferase
VATDIAEAMVRQARHRAGSARPTEWAVMDAAQPAVSRPCGLILSSAVLHWIIPIHRAFASLSPLLTPRGCLVAALMLEGTLRELRAARRRVAPGNPPRGRLPRPAEVRQALRQVGLESCHWAIETMTVRCSSAAALLRALHRQGLTGGDLSRGSKSLTRRELSALTAKYECACRRHKGGVTATYRVLYLVARKPLTTAASIAISALKDGQRCV